MHTLNGIGNAPVSRQEKRAVAQKERAIATQNPFPVGTEVSFGKGNKQFRATVIGPRRQDGLYPLRPAPPLDQVMPTIFMPPSSMKGLGQVRARGRGRGRVGFQRRRPSSPKFKAGLWVGWRGGTALVRGVRRRRMADRVQSEWVYTIIRPSVPGQPFQLGPVEVGENELSFIPQPPSGELDPAMAPAQMAGMGYHPPHLKPSPTQHPAGSPSYQATPQQDYNLPLYRRMQRGARDSPASPNYVVADIGPRGIPPGLVPPEMLYDRVAPQAATPSPAASPHFEIAGMGRNIPGIIIAPSPAMQMEPFREGVGLGRKWDPWGEE